MSRRSTDLPTLEQIRRERSRLQYRSRYGRALRSTLRALAVAAALAVLVATLWLPVLRIYGSSMWPTLMGADRPLRQDPQLRPRRCDGLLPWQ